MSAQSTTDGKNRNPILANTTKRKDFEYLRYQQELDDHCDDDIDAYESKPSSQFYINSSL